MSLLLNRLDCGHEACIRWFSGPHAEGVSFLLDVLGAGTRPSRHPALQLLRLCLEHAGASLIAAGSDARSKRAAVATLQLVLDFVVWGWYARGYTVVRGTWLWCHAADTMPLAPPPPRLLG